MSCVAQTEPLLAAAIRSRVEIRFRRFLVLLSIIAGIGLVAHFSLLLWARHEFSQPESVVGAHSMMLAYDGVLYYALNNFPYTVSAYTPLFYGLEAALSKLGLAFPAGGRLLSFASLLGIIVLVWRLLILYTGDRYCAWMGALLCASTSVLVAWGTVGQVDTMALFWSLAAFYQFSRYHVRGDKTLVWAGVFAVLALYTKQTAIACPAAIFTMLWFRRRQTALRFGVLFGAAVLILAMAINTAVHGRFLADTVFANLNPFAFVKIARHAKYAAVMAGGLAVVALAGARRAMRSPTAAIWVYLGMAAAVLAVTAPKIGSDTNYQIESTVVLILCACVALHALNFFSSCFARRGTWITLLQLPLAVHLIFNFAVTAENVIVRVQREQQFRREVAALRPYFAGGGRVISTELDPMVRLRGRIEVEPLIYKLLVAAGAVDPEPLRRELAAENFSAVILYEDAFHGAPDPNPEIPTLPAAQLDEIRKHYRLVEHISGPYLNGVYVYQAANRLLTRAAR